MSLEHTPFSRNPDVLQGQTVFTGTRVPLDIVQSYKREGGEIEEFLENYPTIERWKVEYAWRLSDEELEALVVGDEARIVRDAIQRGLDGAARGTGEDADTAFESLEQELEIRTSTERQNRQRAAADQLFKMTPEELGQAAIDRAKRERKEE